MKRLSLIGILFLPGLVHAVQVTTGSRFALYLAESLPRQGLLEMTDLNSKGKVYLHPEAVVTNKELVAAQVQPSSQPGFFEIEFAFDEEGARRLESATGDHIGKLLAIVVEGNVISAPVLRGRIYDTAVLSARLSREEAERIATGIKGSATAPVLRVNVNGRLTRRPKHVSGSRVTLTSDRESLQTPVQEDGSFEFLAVLPGPHILRPVLDSILLPSIAITIPARDLEGIQVQIPPVKDVPGRVVVERDGPAPPLSFRWIDSSGESNIQVVPRGDGTFTMTLPEGEGRLLLFTLFPSGYTLNSFTYGATDLRTYGATDPNSGKILKVSNADPSELRVSFATAPNAWFSVSGRVIGFDASRMTTVSMSSNVLLAPKVEPVRIRPDGTFELPKVLPGFYQLEVDGNPVIGMDVVDSNITNAQVPVP